MSYIGIDLGTSSVKAVLVDNQQRLLASATTELSLQRPQPLWSEQAPADWVTATLSALRRLRDADLPAFRA